MSTRITIPLVSTNAADVTVTGWRVQPGEIVTAGQVVADVATDKAAFEIESPAEGVLLHVFAPSRSIVPISYIVGLVGQPGENDPGIDPANQAIEAAHRSQILAQDPALPYPEPVEGQLRPSPLPKGVGEGFTSSDRTFAEWPGAVSSTPSAPRATPKARRLAAEQGLDLARIQAETGAAILTEAILAPYLKG